MTDTERKRLGVIANYVAGKVDEYQYQLRELVEACDAANGEFQKNGPAGESKKVVYSFSALVNAMQSLKDSLNCLGDDMLTWAEIGKNPYGDFMYKARNAATHDGNPIVNAWADGRFYVSNDINRFDMRGNEIEIVCPDEDIRIVCLKFSKSFAAQIRGSLSNMLGQYSTTSTVEFEDIENAIINSRVMPDYVKNGILQHEIVITGALKNAPDFDYAKNAIDRIDALTVYCNEQNL